MERSRQRKKRSSRLIGPSPVEKLEEQEQENSIPLLTGSERHLQFVLLNLLSTVLKVTQRGSIKMVASYSDDEYQLCLSIAYKGTFSLDLPNPSALLEEILASSKD